MSSLCSLFRISVAISSASLRATAVAEVRIFAAALFLSLSLSSALNASSVTVTGGFTSFSGVVGGTNDGITSTLNGAPLCADSGCEFTAMANKTFSPQSSLLFQNFSPSANPANLVQFVPAAPQNVLGTGQNNPFLLGQLTFTNGIWTGSATNFGFTLTTHSPDMLFNSKQITDTLVMQVTPNTFGFGANTPDQNADFVYFSGNPILGSVRAYELTDSPNGSNTVTVDLIGYINSLHLLEFANAQGGGFINSSVDIAPVVTPLPAALPLFASGLGALGLLARRRKRKAVVVV